YEDAVAASRAFAASSGWYDANPSGPNSMIGVSGFSQLGREILLQLCQRPSSVWLPASNGTLALGVVGLLGSESPDTLVAIVGSRGNTAATASLRAGVPITLDPRLITETLTNAPLASWESAQAEDLVRHAR